MGLSFGGRISGGLSRLGLTSPICSGPSIISRPVCPTQAIRPSMDCRRGQNGGPLSGALPYGPSIATSLGRNAAMVAPSIFLGRSQSGSIPCKMAEGRGVAASV